MSHATVSGWGECWGTLANEGGHVRVSVHGADPLPLLIPSSRAIELYQWKWSGTHSGKLFCQWTLLELDMLLRMGDFPYNVLYSYMERLSALTEMGTFCGPQNRSTENGSRTGGERLFCQWTPLDALLTPGGTPCNGSYEGRGAARKEEYCFQASGILKSRGFISSSIQKARENIVI